MTISSKNAHSNFLSFLIVNKIKLKTVESLISQSYVINLSKGETFIPDYTDSAIVYLNTGMLREDVEFTESHYSVSNLFFKNSVLVGNSPYEKNPKFSSMYVAKQDSELLVTPGNTLYSEIRNSKELLLFVLQSHYSKNSYARDLKVIRCFSNKKQYIVTALTLLFYRRMAEGGRSLPLTYEEIGSLTGCTRQYCSQILQELIEDDVIYKRYGALEVADFNRLKKMIDEKILNHFKQYLEA